jgi:hypothetical protein
MSPLTQVLLAVLGLLVVLCYVVFYAVVRRTDPVMPRPSVDEVNDD